MPLIHDPQLDAPPAAKPSPDPAPPRLPIWPIHRFVEEHAPPGWSIRSTAGADGDGLTVSWRGTAITLVVSRSGVAITGHEVFVSATTAQARARLDGVEAILAFADDLAWFVGELSKSNS